MIALLQQQYHVDPISIWESGLRLLLAVVGAGLIGWERERKNRPAGLRTHILVSLGACLFTLLALDLHQRRAETGMRLDPLRVIEGIVGGIGFLGAGAILQSRRKIYGLTTAAGIWVVAAVGVAAACGNYPVLAMAVALAWVTLALLARLEGSSAQQFDGREPPIE